MNEELKYEILKEIWSWIKTIIIAVCLALFITNYIIVNARVPTGSMATTIRPDDRLVANRLSYLFNDPSRGDIIVFPFFEEGVEPVLYVKRIVGIPGETIEIIEGDVYINGEKLTETYVSSSPIHDQVYNLGPLDIPEGHYFMMGDNRGDSADSRYWNDKFLSEEHIIGKVLFKYYPVPGLIK